MPFENEPKPSGQRGSPPAGPRVAISDLGGPGGKVAIIVVADLAEETVLVKGFESQGWEVRLADGELDALCADRGDVRVVVSDDFELVRLLGSSWDKKSRPVFLALMSWHDDTYRYARDAGADGAVVRPIDNHNPLAYCRL